MNKECRLRKTVFILLQALSLTALPIIAVSLLLRNLGLIVGAFVESGENAKFDFALIFEQVRDASLSLHWLLPFLLGVAFSSAAILLFAGIQNKALRVTVTVTVYILLFILAFLFSLLLTRVNGVRFCDLLAKLIPLIDKL